MPPLSFGFPAGGLGNRRKVIVASGLIDCGIPFFLKSVICAGPHQKVAVKYVEWTSVEEKFAIFLGFCLDFCAALDVGGSAWKWGIGGPCRDRTYDQLIKRSRVPSEFSPLITNAYTTDTVPQFA